MARSFRVFGQVMDKIGQKIEVHPYIDHLQPSTRFVPYLSKRPVFKDVAFIAPNASVIGDVVLDRGTSVWYGAVIRGDVNSIRIGINTSIMDNVMIHSAKIHHDYPTSIGDNVLVCSNATIHAATIEDQCLIGEGAIVLDGAVVKKGSVVSPGSVVTPGKVVGSGELWAGTPAKFVRKLIMEEQVYIKDLSLATNNLADAHDIETWGRGWRFYGVAEDFISTEREAEEDIESKYMEDDSIEYEQSEADIALEADAMDADGNIGLPIIDEESLEPSGKLRFDVINPADRAYLRRFEILEFTQSFNLMDEKAVGVEVEFQPVEQLGIRGSLINTEVEDALEVDDAQILPGEEALHEGRRVRIHEEEKKYDNRNK